MRFANYVRPDGAARTSVIGADGLIRESTPSTVLSGLLADPGALREAGTRALADPADVLDPGQVRLTAPVPEPPSVRDFMAFEQHLTTISGAAPHPDWYQLPVFYFSNPAAITGPRDDVAISPGSSRFDYELEVAAVIGRPGADLNPEEAEDHIAGYFVMCDFSARDLQEREMRLMLGPAKGKDGAISCGPYLVTPDELDARRSRRTFDLAMTATVNGRPYSAGRLDSMYWSFGELIAYASRGTRLRTGDIIGSGTVGTGCVLELSIRHGTGTYPWLRPGDEVSLSVEALGRLEHKIVAGPPSRPLRPDGDAQGTSGAAR